MPLVITTPGASSAPDTHGTPLGICCRCRRSQRGSIGSRMFTSGACLEVVGARSKTDVFGRARRGGSRAAPRGPGDPRSTLEPRGLPRAIVGSGSTNESDPAVFRVLGELEPAVAEEVLVRIGLEADRLAAPG